MPSEEEVTPGEGEGDTEDKDEQHESIGVEGEIVDRVVNSPAIEAFILAIGVNRNSRDGNIAEKDRNELFPSALLILNQGHSYQDTGPDIIVFRSSVNAERLLEPMTCLVALVWGVKRGFGIPSGLIADGYIGLVSWVRLNWL